MSKFKLSLLTLVCAASFVGQANATGVNAIQQGNGANAAGGGASISIGASSEALQGDSIALGQLSSSSGAAAMSLGAYSSASAAQSVALGLSSVANREGKALDAVTFNGQTITAGSGAAWVSSYGAASIGSDAKTRQLMGVAAGSKDTDAVNVAQLKDLKDYSDATFTTASNTIFGEGASNVITPAVTGEDGSITDATLAQNAVIMGNNAKVLVDNGVAIGANSVATTEGRTATGPALKPETSSANFNAWESTGGIVSFGYTETTGEGTDAVTTTHNRTLTGVAAGSEDNDAVNVAQLKQLENNTATQLNNLMTGETKVSTVQLTAVNEDGTPVEGGPTIGLRYQVAAAAPAALADGDSGTATQSQGRLIYNNLDATGKVIGTETVATLNDGINISVGTAQSGTREGEAAPVKVDLNKGISFLTDSDYLSANVASDNNGGAVVTFSTTQALKDALANAGGSTGGNTGGDSGSSGNTGGSGWTPSQAQLAAMNGNFANGITVTPGEGNQAIQIKQGNVDMGGNRIQNVGNPINDGDAANKAYVDSTSRSLRNKINDVDKDLRAGVAMAMAVGGLPQAYMPGKSIVGVSAGTYHGQGGFALGLSHATDNRQWVFKGAASVDTRGNFGGQLSAGYQF